MSAPTLNDRELVEVLARAMFAAVKRDSNITFDEVPPIREAYMTGARAILPIIHDAVKAETERCVAIADMHDWQGVIATAIRRTTPQEQDHAE